MNLTVNSDHLLAMPVTTNLTHMAVYMLLLLLADPSGEVTESRSAIAERMNTPVVIIDAAIRSLVQQKLLVTEGAVIRILANKSWKLSQQKAPVAKRVISKVVSVPSKLSVSDRIEAFVRNAREEFSSWRNRHKDAVLPESEEDAFISYWTEHNEGGSTFRREREKVWQWQRRITTWFNNYKGRVTRTAGSSQVGSDKDGLRQLNEKMHKAEQERIEQARRAEWLQREKNRGGLSEYHRELRMAADGDEEMRRKYPDWEYLVSKNL